MTLVGASLGGAIALDFAHEFPEAVKQLVLIDAQGFIDGSGPGASLPGPLARLGVQVLGSKVSSLWLSLSSGCSMMNCPERRSDISLEHCSMRLHTVAFVCYMLQYMYGISRRWYVCEPLMLPTRSHSLPMIDVITQQYDSTSSGTFFQASELYSSARSFRTNSRTFTFA